MNRISLLTCAFVVALSSHPSLYAQSSETREAPQADSLLARLKGAKHVGLRADQTLSGFVLYLYTPQQRQENLDSLTDYREKSAEYHSRFESIRERHEAAHRERLPIAERNALGEEMQRIQRERPEPPISVRIRTELYDVVHFGVDYVEIRRVEKPQSLVLIPLSKICRVVVESADEDAKAGESGDEPESR